MSLQGGFDPTTETRPAVAYPDSANLIDNSSAELSAPATTTTAATVEWSTEQAHSGGRSSKITFAAGTGHATFTIAVMSPPVGMLSFWVYAPAAAVGKALQVSTGPGGELGAVGLVGGWQKVSGVVVPPSTMLTSIRFEPFHDSPAWLAAGPIYIDDMMIAANPTSIWEPADGEPFYTANQSWYCTAAGTFEGLTIAAGDLLYCTSPGWSLYTDATWTVNPPVESIAEAMAQHPIGLIGHPIGLGDWQLAVEILLPFSSAALWGVAHWGEAAWSVFQWVDLTPWVRGVEWSRGASQFAGRPEVGELVVTLDNAARQFSPWNGVSAFHGAVVTDPATGVVATGYFAPGTLVRVGVYSPSGQILPYTAPGTLDPGGPDAWVAQFTGLVESWVDETDGIGAESFVTVTAIETMSWLAPINDNALGSPVGNDDSPVQRVTRLCESAAWPFGVIDAFEAIDPADGVGIDAAAYTLQSTDMAQNRITEVYRTVDSVGAVARTDRTGALVIYNTPPNAADQSHGPDWAAVAALSHTAAQTGGVLTVPYVADSTCIANDSEPVVNDVRLARVGGTQRSGFDTLSQLRLGRRPYERNDLICKSDTLIDFIIDVTLDNLANRTRRLEQVSIHGLHPYTLAVLIGLDIHGRVDVELPDFDGNTVTVNQATVDGYTHRITPLDDTGVVWTADVTFGVQQAITIEEI